MFKGVVIKGDNTERLRNMIGVARIDDQKHPCKEDKEDTGRTVSFVSFLLTCMHDRDLCSDHDCEIVMYSRQFIKCKVASLSQKTPLLVNIQVCLWLL